MARKTIQNHIEIYLADDTGREFVLAGHLIASAAIDSIKRLHRDLLLQPSNILEPGGTRRIGRTVCRTAGCRKPQGIFRRISRRDAKCKSRHRRISAAHRRTWPKRHDRSKEHWRTPAGAKKKSLRTQT